MSLYHYLDVLVYSYISVLLHHHSCIADCQEASESLLVDSTGRPARLGWGEGD